MADNQHSQLGTESKKKKSVFLLRVVRVMLQACILVGEDRRGFLKLDAVFALILFSLGIVPCKPHCTHNDIILLMALPRKGLFFGLSCRRTPSVSGAVQD